MDNQNEYKSLTPSSPPGSYYGGSQPSDVLKQREPLIPSLLERLSKAIQEGLQLTDGLESRMSPILKPGPPDARGGQVEASAVRAEMVERLSQLLQAAVVLNSRLHSINHRLEL